MPTRLRIAAARLYASGAALVFVLSLGTGVLLDRRLGRAGTSADATPNDLRDLVLNVALFSAFALHHSAMARTGVKTWISRYVPPPLERATYVWVASALFAATCLLWRQVPHLIYQVDPPWAWIFTAARVGGVWLTLDSASRLDPRELAGLRQAWTYGNESGPPTEAEAAPLVARGGYRLVRHPIYLGWILMVWGVPSVTAGRLAFAAISTAYLLVAIPIEERSLRERFGRGYAGYAEAVRWRVLPGLY